MQKALRRRGRIDWVGLVLALPTALGFIHVAPLSAQDDPAEPEKPPPRAPNWITVGIGTQRQVVDGNSFRFHQYVTPPNGTYPSIIEVGHPLDDEGHTFGFTFRDLLEPTAGGVGYAYDVDLGLRADSRYRRSVFYRDFYQGAHHIRRKDWETDFRWRATPRDHLMGSYHMVDLSGLRGDPDQNFLDERYGLQYSRAVRGYNAVGRLDFEQFGFPAGAPYLAGEARSWTVGFGPGHDGGTLFAGTAKWTTTDLKGDSRSPDETAVTLSGFHQLTDDIALMGDLRFWELDDSIAQNGYGRRERLAAAEGQYTGLWRSTLRAGFESAAVDYVNGPQTQVVQPAVNTSLLALRSRPRRDVKVQFDFNRRRVDDRPLSFDLAEEPVATRIWSQVDMLRARATWTPTFAVCGVTGGYRSDQRENPNQGTSNEIITRDITAWWSPTDAVSLSGSYMEQDFGLRGVGTATPYLSDAESWYVNANWQATPNTSVSTGFTRADSFGSIELKQLTWSLNVDHAWREHKVTLGLVLDDLTDYNGTLLGYDADLLYAEFSTRLP